MYLYKHPVTSQNGNNYSVLIYDNSLFENSYIVKLYIKNKILWFYKDSCVLTNIFNYCNYEFLQNNTLLFINFAEQTVLQYEKTILYKENLINKNIDCFKKWDGQCNLCNEDKN